VVQTYDAPEVAPVAVAPAFSWDGFYIGGQLGGSWGDTTVSSQLHGGSYVIPPMQPLPLTSSSLWRFSPDPSGFVGGIYAGYNFDLDNNVIVGVETDFVWGDVDGSDGHKAFDLSTVGGTNFMNGRIGVEQKWAGATRLRVGYAMDRFLPYIAGGVAYAKVKSSAHAYLSATPGGAPLPPIPRPPNPSVPVPQYNFGNSDTFTGWTLGVGTEYAMTDNVLLRLEYRYADYGSETYHHVIPGGGTAAISYTVDHKTHDLRFGVAYKF